MNKLFFILSFFLMTPFILYSQNVVDIMNSDTVNKLDANKQKTGYWVEKVGDQFSRGYYTNNQKIGIWITTLNTNLLQRLENYFDGRKSGISLMLDRKGHLIEQSFYKNGLLNGLSTVYSTYSEIPVSEVNYTDGKKTGLSKIYYDNGKVQEEANYKTDIKVGITKWFNKAGKMVAEYNYKDGSFQGLQKTFYDNDTLQTVTEYDNNIMSGDYKEYYRNGITKFQGKYINGQKDGPWVEFDELGKAIKTTKYKNGIAK